MVINVRYEMMKYEAVRNLRVDGGYTQQQIADYLHIKQNTYSQYEIGVLNYPVEVLSKLADFYGVSVKKNKNGGGGSTPPPPLL